MHPKNPLSYVISQLAPGIITIKALALLLQRRLASAFSIQVLDLLSQRRVQSLSAKSGKNAPRFGNFIYLLFSLSEFYENLLKNPDKATA